MKKLFYLCTLGLLFAFLSCDVSAKQVDADKLQAQETTASLAEANREIGMPAIKNFQERKLFKQILELRDQENLITYCYFFNELKGEVGQFLGKGIGYGIPASTQFTNPEKIVHQSYEAGASTLPQADPNGMFMPTSTDATYYMLLDENGVPHPVYIEPHIIVSPVPLHKINETL